jgi:GNAT superfamily N-acetyltransferase
MTRVCNHDDLDEIELIINEAAVAYKGVIPDDCFHEPYMTRNQLLSELNAGIKFWGWGKSGSLLGVMGIQHVMDVSLIRHAYVRTEGQRCGIGGKLLAELIPIARGPLLVGTWANAHWAIRFYQMHGFTLMENIEKDYLLSRYWEISERQKTTSVVLKYQNSMPLIS